MQSKEFFMNIALSAESTIDLQKDLLDFYRINTVPYTLTMGDKVALDGEVEGSDLFAYTTKTGKLAKSSAVNQEQFKQHFRSLLKDHEAVIHFSLSSDMSSSYNNACFAAKELGLEDKIFVVDSRSLSTGIALQAIYARKLIDAGKRPEEIVPLVAERVPSTQASFGLEAVDYLYKGGRCSAMAVLGANLLHIRPQIIVKDGKMISGKKYRGPMDKWVHDYVETTLAEFNNPDLDEVFITYSSAPDEVVEMVRSRLKKAGFHHIMNTNANGTVCCHCGPHTLGILYFNDGPHPIH
jgi:DegV family protein with EDD domain